MKFSSLLLLVILSFGNFHSAQAQDSTRSISDSIPILTPIGFSLPSELYEKEKPFEIVFPIATEFVISKYTPVFNFPAGAIGLGIRNFQFGVKGALNGFHGTGGSIRIFASAYTSRLTIERKRAYFLSLEGGSAFRKDHVNRARFGLGLGYLSPIGSPETPANVRLQLTPFLDFWSGQIEPGFSLGLGIGLPIGLPKPKPAKKTTP